MPSPDGTPPGPPGDDAVPQRGRRLAAAAHLAGAVAFMAGPALHLVWIGREGTAPKHELGVFMVLVPAAYGLSAPIVLSTLRWLLKARSGFVRGHVVFADRVQSVVSIGCAAALAWMILARAEVAFILFSFLAPAVYVALAFAAAYHAYRGRGL